MAMVALPKANAAGRNGKRSKEDVVKEQYEKKLEEQEEKHQKTIEAAAEIEDSLRAVDGSVINIQKLYKQKCAIIFRSSWCGLEK